MNDKLQEKKFASKQSIQTLFSKSVHFSSFNAIYELGNAISFLFFNDYQLLNESISSLVAHNNNKMKVREMQFNDKSDLYSQIVYYFHTLIHVNKNITEGPLRCVIEQCLLFIIHLYEYDHQVYLQSFKQGLAALATPLVFSV